MEEQRRADVTSDDRRARRILTELGFTIARTDAGIRGTSHVTPEMWVPGTDHLRTSILATWVDHVAGLAAMALGSLLRIRLYLVLGLAAVLVDLASIAVKVLVGLDRGEQMTSVGLLVLLVGGGLVSGAIYYKTHRGEIEAWLDTSRRRFGSWE